MVKKKMDKEKQEIHIHKHYADADQENNFRVVEVITPGLTVNIRSFILSEDIDFMVKKAIEVYDYIIHKD